MPLPRVTVTLALVSGPGLPAGEHPERRIELEAVLDSSGRLDAGAWQADSRPWLARTVAPGAAPVEGDVQFDPDQGWSLRFWAGTTEGPDAMPAQFDPGADPIRPGEYVTLRQSDGRQFGYRVVGVAALPLPAQDRRG